MDIHSFWQDATYGFRTLRKSPSFTLVAIFILALGIGANTAISTAVYHVLLQPLPYADSDRLVALWEDFSFIGFPRNNFSPADYIDWKKQSTVFEDIATHRGRTANLTSDGAPETVLGRAVTANLFSVLGVSPLLGRTFTEQEDRRQAPVVVISHSLWSSRFQRDPRLIGRSILMNGGQVTVIGVMPPSFVFPNRAASFWSPLNFGPKEWASRGNHFLNVVARLRPDATLEQARIETSQIAKQLERVYPASNSRVGAVVLPLRDDMVGDTRLPLLILIAASGLVLLIACSNIANLLLARSSGRAREMAIRGALGAGSRRLIRQVVIEALMLSSTGGALGLVVAAWCLGVLERLVPNSLSSALSMDGRILAFTAVIAIGSGLLFGLAPALQGAAIQLNTVLKQGGGRSGTDGGTKRLRDALVISEVALAFVLLVGAGLMLRTLARLQSENPGFEPDRLLTMQTVLPRLKYKDDSKRMAFVETVLERLRNTPGVVSAGFASDLPFTSIGNTSSFRLEDRPAPSNNLDYDALYRESTTGYLQSIGSRLIAGRFFNDYDAADSLPVVIINETFAKSFWPNEYPIGKRVQVGGAKAPWLTIIGVVADLRERGLLLPMKPAVYLSDSQVKQPSPDYLAIRTAGDPVAIVNAVRRAVWAADPEQPISRVGTMRELMERETSSRHEAMMLLLAFAGLALLLASLGIYGVLSYTVTQRTQEMGVRIALGASRGEVVGMILRQGLTVAGIGIGVGIAASLAASRALGGLLYGVSTTDPLTFIGVPVFLLLVAAIACYLPARRAAGVDPLVALRYE